MTGIQRFALDETKAREWLKKVIAATGYALFGEGEDPAPGEDLPEITVDWNPRQYEEGCTIAALVRCAAAAAVITGPDGMEIEFRYSRDDDGGYYNFHVGLAAGIYTELSACGCEMRKIGDGEATGLAAAMSILREAAGSANGALDDLDKIIARRNG